MYNKLLRMANKLYFGIQPEYVKYDMKTSCLIIKSAMNRENHKTSPPDYFNVNNNKLTDKKQKVKWIFAKYCQGISNNVPESNFHYAHFQGNRHDKSMFLDPISETDINITSNLKS